MVWDDIHEMKEKETRQIIDVRKHAGNDPAMYAYEAGLFLSVDRSGTGNRAKQHLVLMDVNGNVIQTLCEIGNADKFIEACQLAASTYQLTKD